jgi:SPP1 family predicted phage head-tail adaptor
MQPAGKRNRLITIQQRATGTDAAGQPSTTWETFRADVWAWYKAAAGGAAAERIAGNQETSVLACSWRVEYATDITAGMRVIDENSTVYDIALVSPDYADRQFTDLVCTAGASQG